MMDRQTLNETAQLCEKLIDQAHALLEEIDRERGYFTEKYRGTEWETDGKPKPSDRLISGNKVSGQVRRTSLDLTRKLAELRRP